MKKLTLPVLLTSAFIFAACTPSAPITGTEEQKAEKLAQIISSGGTAACKVTNLSDNGTIDYVVSGKKMKVVGSDFGQGKKGTMINDAVYTYFWEEGQASGFKMKNPTEAEIKEGTDKAKQFEQDYDTEKTASMYDDETKYKLDCARRTVSDSEFVPPQAVKFVDPSELNTMPQE